MKNLLVFLHGKGADENDKQDFVSHLADFYEADVLTINAPFPHKKGYKWFEKVEGFASQEDFAHSLSYLSNILSKVSSSYEKLVFVGHSQGGIMAISSALRLGADIAISLCGDVPKGLIIPKDNHKTQIFWVEGEKDDFLSNERKKTYHFFKDNKYNLVYILESNTSHNEFDLQIITNLS